MATQAANKAWERGWPSSPIVQSNCPVQLSSPTVQSSPVQSMFCTMPKKHEEKNFVNISVICNCKPLLFSEKTRRKEHERNVKNCKKGSNIANHAWANDHRIDFANGKIIDTTSYRHRSTLESWHTARFENADNNAKHLSEQYRFLLNKT